MSPYNEIVLALYRTGRGSNGRTNDGGSAGPNAHNQLATSERIKRAALKLFALHGVDAVTVRDVVKERARGTPRRSTIISARRTS